MAVAASVVQARSLLYALGYRDGDLAEQFPVSPGVREQVEVVDLVAFRHGAPRDISTAVVAMFSRPADVALRAAQPLGVPFVLIAAGDGLDLWVIGDPKPQRWRPALRAVDAAEVPQLRPSEAFAAKIGLRQLPLFNIPVNLLDRARRRSAEQLGPIVARALQDTDGVFEDAFAVGAGGGCEVVAVRS